MNKKSVRFIFPRQQIQDRRNVFEGSRTATLLGTVEHSKKACATWVSCTKDQESSAAQDMSQRLSFKKGQGEKLSCQAQHMSCRLQGAAETTTCVESSSLSVSQQCPNAEF